MGEGRGEALAGRPRFSHAAPGIRVSSSEPLNEGRDRVRCLRVEEEETAESEGFLPLMFILEQLIAQL